MTDRVTAFLVVLDRDIRDDDAQPTLDAIKQIRFVATVEPVVREHALDIRAAVIRRNLAWTESLWHLAANAPADLTGEGS
jgi:hypothetical protein